MLSWTEAGAVKRPTTLQIRVQRRYPGRVRAGAPTPTRSLSREEVVTNLRHFTEGQRGPRTAPCTSLVLSGVGLLSSSDTAPLLETARILGIDRVVLHAGQEDLTAFTAEPWRRLVDVLVVPLQPDDERSLEAGVGTVAACRASGIEVAVNTVLHAASLANLDHVAQLVARLQPDSCPLSYPFPSHDDQPSPPTPSQLLPALSRAIGILEDSGAEPRIKGLPACWLGDMAGRLRPSSNRWYVDADHQLDQALMFFPHVLAFHKGEACRFCDRDARCDGFFSDWLGSPGFPPLEPVQG